jgi:hypothetical protein
MDGMDMDTEPANDTDMDGMDMDTEPADSTDMDGMDMNDTGGERKND